MDNLMYLTYIAIILLAGLICLFISRKLRLPNALLLLLVGLSFGAFSGISFSLNFLVLVSTIAIIVALFDSSARLKFKEFDSLPMRALKFFIISLVLNLVFLSFSIKLIFGIPSFALCLLFAALVTGTNSESIHLIFGKAKNKVAEFIDLEALINTPFTIIIPFIILELTQKQQVIFENITDQTFLIVQQFIVGIGTGILVGIIIARFIKKNFNRNITPIVIIASALLAYVIAEQLGGNGIFAVCLMALVLGNSSIRGKQDIYEISSAVSLILEIFVFVVIGIIIKLPFNMISLRNSFVLFIIYTIIRYISIAISSKKEYKNKEKLFIALNSAKGIALAVVILALSTMNITGIKPILDLAFMFMLYSLIISAITLRFSKYFIKDILVKKHV